MKFSLKKIIDHQSGATAVEMAFCLPIFLFFVLALLSFSQAFWISNTMNYAVNEAGRYAMAHKTSSHSDIQERVGNHLMGIDKDDVTITVSDTTINGAPFRQIQASYSYGFKMLKGFFGLDPSVLTATTAVPVS